jgi:ribosomal protein L12E/L44/L45/RPP1/RPP2
MTKFVALLVAAFFAVGAQAASHAGGAPMKDKAASAPAAKKDEKKDAKAEKKEEKKAEEKKK